MYAKIREIDAGSEHLYPGHYGDDPAGGKIKLARVITQRADIRHSCHLGRKGLCMDEAEPVA